MLRRLAYKALGGKCEECGSTIQLVIHHKDGNPNNNDEENLALLCRRCHKRKHPHINPLKRAVHNRKTLGRKKKVIIYLYPDEIEMLDQVCRKTGDTRSELLRRLFRNYLDELNIIRERVHS